jgi:hypothetical protein
MDAIEMALSGMMAMSQPDSAIVLNPHAVNIAQYAKYSGYISDLECGNKKIYIATVTIDDSTGSTTCEILYADGGSTFDEEGYANGKIDKEDQLILVFKGPAGKETYYDKGLNGIKEKNDNAFYGSGCLHGCPDNGKYTDRLNAVNSKIQGKVNKPRSFRNLPRRRLPGNYRSWMGSGLRPGR